MGEPHGAIGPLPDGIGYRGRPKHAARQAPGIGQVSPGSRARADGLRRGPALRRRKASLHAGAHPFVLGKAGGQTDHLAQQLADVTEVQLGAEVPHQAEHIALGGSPGIPPAASAVVDDDDLALATPVLQAIPGAFRLVQLPGRRQPFQQGGAVHALPQPLQFLVLIIHLPESSAWIPPANRETDAGQGRSRGLPRRGRRQPTHPCRAAVASGSGLPSLTACRIRALSDCRTKRRVGKAGANGHFVDRGSTRASLPLVRSRTDRRKNRMQRQGCPVAGMGYGCAEKNPCWRSAPHPVAPRVTERHPWPLPGRTLG
ncbi:hypothetical protein ROTAS13_04641 [Roseomonas sp. TAS13]|nr:hypothetical protein ROTAS13_04641 [Roseomonas sp. TAS13]